MSDALALDRLRQFARWVIQEAWGQMGCDPGDIQDKAVELGLLREVLYDPEKHGPNDVDAEPGDPWFVFTDLMVEPK